MTLTNTGKVPLHFGNIRGIGPNVSEFGIDKSAGNCGVIPPGGSCFVNVTFTPTVIGAASATAIIEDDAAGSPQSVTATGTGVAGQVALVPPTLNFFNQVVGIASLENSMQLFNGSAATITLTSSVLEGGTNPGDFKIDNANTTCASGLKIAAGSSCSVAVIFTASAAGARNATLTFNFTGASGSPLVGNLTGVGFSGVSVFPNPINVGAQFVGFSGSGVGATLFNATPTPLTVTSFVVSGPNQADFTAVTVSPFCAPGGVVPADSKCFLQGTFAPLDLGPRTATATLSFTGPAGSPIAITVNGTGIRGPVTLCPSPTTPFAFCSFGFIQAASFGGQIVNTASPPQRYILTNLQKVPLHIATLAKGGTNPTQFAIAPTSTCVSGLTVNAGATCYVDVESSPTVTGALSATVVITDDGPGSPRTITLNGTGEPAAITTSDSILDFGDRTVGVLKQRAVALINGGTSAISITANPTITGTNATDFAIVTTPPGSTTCVLSAKVLGSGGICAVTISFTPAATGLRTATLTIFDNGAGNPRVVALQGNGVLTPNISPSTTSLNFPNTGTNTTSAPLPVTLTNTGNGPLTLSTIALNGAPNPGDFNQTNNCPVSPATLAPAANCTINVTFKPTATGFRNSSISIQSDSGKNGNTQTIISLFGNGVTPGVTVNPTSVDFGTVAVGVLNTSSSAIGVTNNTNNPVTIGTVTIGGTNSADFALSFNGCTNGLVLAANGGSCSVGTVNFTPGGAGPRNASISIPFTGASGSPLSVTLTGVGSGTLLVTPNPLAFPPTQAGTSGALTTATIQNGTATRVTITSVGSPTGANPGDFSVNSSGCPINTVLAAGGTCQFQVTFSPTITLTPPPATDTRTAQIAIATTGGNPNLSLTGTAIEPFAQLSPNPLIFGPQTVNTQSAPLAANVADKGAVGFFISKTAITGPNADDFALAGGFITGQCFGFVSPNSSCTVNILFTPSGTGLRTATLTITDTANTPSQSITLQGTGLAGTVSLRPAPLNFPTQNVGTPSESEATIYTNTTDPPVTITSITVTGTNAGDFTVAPSSTCKVNLLVSSTVGTCVVNVIFNPQGVNGRSALLTVTDTKTGSHSITLNGNGANAVVSVSPNPLNFGNQLVGTTSGTLFVTLSNGTGSAVTVTAAPSLSGGNVGDFAVAAGTTCANGFVLVANTGSCIVNLTFTPGATGLRTTTLTIKASDAGSPHNVTINGTGTQPIVALSTNSVQFGNVTKGVTSGVQSVTLTNNGTGNLNISTVVKAGTNPGDFAIVNTSTCTNGAVVPPAPAANTCVLNFTFTPSLLTLESATITITDNASPTTQVITLNGTGVAAVTLTPSPLAFGSQRTGTASGPLTLTLTNSGGTSVTLASSSSVVIGGTNTTDFATATGTTCANSLVLAAGNTCFINIIFTPGANGARSATVTVTDNANPTTQVASLTGTGIFPQAVPSPSPLNFGNQRTGTANTLTITVNNPGTDTLHLAATNAVVIGGGNASDFTIAAGTTCVNSAAVIAGGSCVIKITFAPGGLGARTTTLTITDDANPTTQSVTLNGTGVFPQAVPTPPALNFGVQVIGTTTTVTVTLSNPGTDTLHLAATNAVQLGGTNPGAFPIATGTTCANSTAVLPGANCIIKISFTPGASGVLTATLTITDDASPTTQAVPLTGTGTPVSLSGASLNFGAQAVGATSATHKVTLTNDGVAALTITSITVIGTNNGDFSEPNTCPISPATLAVGANCTISVTFKPTARGKRTASLQISDDAPNTPQLVSLIGVGGTAGDFDGDGKADVAVWRPSTGTWYIVPSSNPNSTITKQFGLQGDIPVPGDYDGDGITDVAVWRPSTGTWYITPSSNPTTFTTQKWGLPGDIPVPGDYDGDGITDFAVWRPSTGTWYIIPSSNPSSPIIQQWGSQGDIPVPGDYDGDGITDFAIWRPSTGTWWIIPSGNPGTPIQKHWGLTGDLPVPGDYDGDGKTDIAAWRPSTGTWYIIPSSNPTTFTTQQWGATGDIPVPRDYDGDRKTDIAVWRPSTGTWYIIPGVGKPIVKQWGLSTDVPVQKPVGQ